MVRIKNRRYPYLAALLGMVGRVLFGCLIFVGCISLVSWVAVIYFAFNCEQVEGLCQLLMS